MILPVLGSLFVGLVIGYLGQKSRMCFIGGFRDFLLVRDKSLLQGTIAFFAASWVTIQVFSLISKMFKGLTSLNLKITNYPGLLDSIKSRFGLITLAGGIFIGLFSTLVGGCPLRQHVLAGQGRVDSMVYLGGFYTGIILYILFLERIIGRWI